MAIDENGFVIFPVNSTISMVFPITQTLSNPGFASFIDSETAAAIKQNFKVMLLTNPGEYQNQIDYGVGIPRYLFENITTEIKEQIRSRILSQAVRFMPYVSVSSVQFLEDNNIPNYLGIKIIYFIRESIQPESIVIQTQSAVQGISVGPDFVVS